MVPVAPNSNPIRTLWMCVPVPTKGQLGGSFPIQETSKLFKRLKAPGESSFVLSGFTSQIVQFARFRIARSLVLDKSTSRYSFEHQTLRNHVDHYLLGATTSLFLL